MHRHILGFKKMNGVIIGADYADEQNNPDTRRGRFIAPNADLSAFSGFHDISVTLLNSL